MKAIVVNKPGSYEVLQLKERPIPKLRSGWSLVKIKAFGINRSEIFTRQGLSPSVKFPRILGIECVGKIIASTDKKRLPINQTVVSLMGEMGRAFDGSYAEYTLLPNEQIYPISANLSWTELAAVPETYYTAFVAMKNLKINANHRLLVRGATSGVGIAFYQLIKAKFPQIEIYGTSRNREKCSKLTRYGFNKGLLDQEGEIRTALFFDRVLELIGPKTIKDSISHMNNDGIICSCGQLGRQWTLSDFDPIEELANDIYLTTSASSRVNEMKLQQLFDFIDYYQMKIKPQRIYCLSEIQKAHQYLESNHSFGKVVINLTSSGEN